MSQKTAYSPGGSRQTDTPLPATPTPSGAVGRAFPRQALATVRLYVHGDDRPLLDHHVDMTRMVRRTTAQCCGLDGVGLTNRFGVRVPPASLQVLVQPLANRPMGRLLRFEVIDWPRRHPDDAGSYEVQLVTEYLERHPDLDALKDEKLAERIYRDAMQSTHRFLVIDVAKYQADPTYSMLNDAP